MLLKKEINILEKIRYFFLHRSHLKAFKKMQPLNDEESFLLKNLKENGYLIIENFIEPEILNKMKFEFQNNLESLNFLSPCLGQSLISIHKHKELIDNHFYATEKELFEKGLMFSNSDVASLQEAIERFNPSTLTTFMLEVSSLYRAIWLDERILRIISAYMGLVPKLTEAYVRRNFPAKHKVMNHFWHRDLNHKHYLLKVFIFLSDCDITNGPHEYITGTHMKFDHLNGKRYFTDSEVEEVYPENSEKRIVSKVKAGTIIIEDTRGLHRARMPEKNFRDLGFAVFSPDLNEAHFNIRKEDYIHLTSFQKLFINKSTVI
jgi:hypothetical protein